MTDEQRYEGLSQQSEAGKQLEILIVDDEKSIREMQLQFLEKILRGLRAYSVELANNGAEAVDKIGLKKGLYDLVLLDNRMPDMSGIEVYSYIKREHPEQAGKVVFVTATSYDLTDAGINAAFLTKPFSYASFAGFIKDFFKLG